MHCKYRSTTSVFTIEKEVTHLSCFLARGVRVILFFCSLFTFFFFFLLLFMVTISYLINKL